MARRRSHRNAQLVRLLALVRDLSRRDGCELYDMAARHQVSVRTIRRDLDALSEAGVPLVDEDDGRRKRWRIDRDDPRRQVGRLVDASHCLALRTALAGLAPQLDAIAAPLDDLAARLETVIRPVDRQRMAGIRDCFDASHSVLLEVSPEVLWPATAAILERRCCEVTYAPPDGRRSQYTVLPLKMFARDGLPYVLVHHRRRDVVMTLALHRVRKVVVTKQVADPPAGFDAHRYVASLFHTHGSGQELTYRLRFDPSVAPYIVERQWHPTQRIRRRRDGAVDLSFTCQQSFQVAAWVASWRHHVCVLSPGVLRSELFALGRELAANYGPA